MTEEFTHDEIETLKNVEQGSEHYNELIAHLERVQELTKHISSDGKKFTPPEVSTESLNTTTKTVSTPITASELNQIMDDAGERTKFDISPGVVTMDEDLSHQHNHQTIHADGVVFECDVENDGVILSDGFTDVHLIGGEFDGGGEDVANHHLIRFINCWFSSIRGIFARDGVMNDGPRLVTCYFSQITDCRVDNCFHNLMISDGSEYCSISDCQSTNANVENAIIEHAEDREQENQDKWNKFCTIENVVGDQSIQHGVFVREAFACGVFDCEMAGSVRGNTITVSDRSKHIQISGGHYGPTGDEGVSERVLNIGENVDYVTVENLTLQQDDVGDNNLVIRNIGDNVTIKNIEIEVLDDIGREAIVQRGSNVTIADIRINGMGEKTSQWITVDETSGNVVLRGISFADPVATPGLDRLIRVADASGTTLTVDNVNAEGGLKPDNVIEITGEVDKLDCRNLTGGISAGSSSIVSEMDIRNCNADGLSSYEINADGMEQVDICNCRIGGERVEVWVDDTVDVDVWIEETDFGGGEINIQSSGANVFVRDCRGIDSTGFSDFPSLWIDIYRSDEASIDVRNLQSPSLGDRSYNDGSSGPDGPAFYDGTDWVSLVDGTTIT